MTVEFVDELPPKAHKGRTRRSSEMTVEFVDELPPKAHKGRAEAPWRAELRAQPGRWAIVPIQPNNTTVYRSAVPGFEFASRTVDGERLTFARYVGEEES